MHFLAVTSSLFSALPSYFLTAVGYTAGLYFFVLTVLYALKDHNSKVAKQWIKWVFAPVLTLCVSVLGMAIFQAISTTKNIGPIHYLAGGIVLLYLFGFIVYKLFFNPNSKESLKNGPETGTESEPELDDSYQRTVRPNQRDLSSEPASPGFIYLFLVFTLPCLPVTVLHFMLEFQRQAIVIACLSCK